tara:strand:- start:285 stop:638 length:354 start_codon:yes stop_codon:yes gene_type:complete
MEFLAYSTEKRSPEGFVSLAHQTIKRITPMPVSINNCHHPLLPTSCNLLLPEAKAGSVIASDTRSDKIPAPTKANPEVKITVNKKNHQNSLLEALPEKVTYLLIQVEIAWLKFIFIS